MIVVDTGVLYAGADQDDRHHPACAELLDTHAGPLLVTVPVIAETAWLIEHRLGTDAEVAFLRSLTPGELNRVDLTDADWDRAIELIHDYDERYPPIITTAMVAEILELNVRTVFLMAQDGRLPASRLPGSRSYRFFLADVVRMLDENRLVPGSLQEEEIQEASRNE